MIDQSNTQYPNEHEAVGDENFSESLSNDLYESMFRLPEGATPPQPAENPPLGDHDRLALAVAVTKHRATPQPAEPASARLIDVATSKTKHVFNGMCPDEIEGPDVRDPDCPACRVLLAAEPASDAVYRANVAESAEWDDCTGEGAEPASAATMAVGEREALELAREALDPMMPGRVSYAVEMRIKQDAIAAVERALATPSVAAEPAASSGDASLAVPEGWKLVPMEPTPAMLSSAMKDCGGIGGGSCGEHAGVDWDDMRSVWSSMLAASPSPEAQEREVRK